MTKVIKILPILWKFVDEQIRVLGLPKNVKKSHWDNLSKQDLHRFIIKNNEELFDSLFPHGENGIGETNIEEAQNRCYDLANLLMMLWNKLEKEK